MKAKKGDWFRVEANDDGTADIFIFGFIGDWIDDLLEDFGFGFDSVQTARKFQAELDALPEATKAIRLHVNSPGGDVFGAVTIANILRDQRDTKERRVESFVEGLAASAASIVIQAGDPIRMADNGLIMIHDPWTRAIGDARELRKAADELDKVKQNSIIATYLWNSSLNEKEISDLMEATTWMDADEAVEWGFATEKVEGLKAAAALSPKDVASLEVPKAYQERLNELVKDGSSTGDGVNDPADFAGQEVQASTEAIRSGLTSRSNEVSSRGLENPAEAAEVLQLCREGDCLDLAESLIQDKATRAQIKATIDTEKKKRASAKERATTIRGLCDTAGLNDLADGYIRSGMDITEVRSHLTKITARAGDLGIDPGLDPDVTGEESIAEAWKASIARVQSRYGRRV